MSKTLSLFDPNPTPHVEPVKRESPSTAPSKGSDVILRVEHKAGPFKHLKPGGEVDRLHYVIVTMDGRVFAEFIDDHSRFGLAAVTKERVAEYVKSGDWREVQG
jgi:hypothetical protein